MKGLELAAGYYNEYGKRMIEEEFAEYADRIAVGLVGEGSECLGYDDEISKDHDFEPGFCLWITEEDERKFGFKLERAYARLPKEFMGYKRERLSPVGGARHGVFTVGEFYRKLIGTEKAPFSPEEWESIPPHRLLAATNGCVFRDDLGVFSEIRETLKKGYPESVRRKKLFDHLLTMAQAGQYNYERCVKRGDRGAAFLTLSEFVKSAISVIYLLNNRYEPFYKWAFRGMRELPILSALEKPLTELLQSGEERAGGLIEEISEKISAELVAEGLSSVNGSTLHAHAYSVIENGRKYRF